MDVPDDRFRHVGRCSRLEKLTGMYCRDTSDVATEDIAGFPGSGTTMPARPASPTGAWRILGGVTSLEDVELSVRAGITGAGLAHLARLLRLEHVSVEARVTREGVAVFPAQVRVNLWT